jgi:hypothetical protein
MTHVLYMILALIFLAGATVFAGTLVATYLLAGEVRLFLKAPAFYIRKLTSGPSAEHKARKITSRIHKLLPAGNSYAEELVDRVRRIVPTIRELTRQHDRITLYLEYNVYGDDLGSSAAAQDEEALRTLERRRDQLGSKIDLALKDLKRIEARVAAHVLAAQDSLEEDSMQAELSETLDELEMLMEGDRAAGMLPR